MSHDDIIRMAQEARLAFDCDDYPDIWQTYMNVGREEIERFFHAAYAAGVAAEREAILQMSREQWFKTQADFEEAIRARSQQ